MNNIYTTKVRDVGGESRCWNACVDDGACAIEKVAETYTAHRSARSQSHISDMSDKCYYQLYG